MGTYLIVALCALVVVAIVGLAMWARRNPSATLDAPDDSGITQREWMNMR